MKIYPDKHRVYFRKQASFEDIPLAYADNDEQDRVFSVSLRPEFGRPVQQTAAYPYMLLPNADVLFFGTDGKPVANSQSYIQKKGAEYIMLPPGARTFTPKKFSFSLLLQRADTYKKTVSYSLACGIKDPDASMQYRIVSAIQGKENRMEYPANIVVNQGKESVPAFQNIEESSCDIIFAPVSSHIDFDKYLDRHINIWLYDDSFGGQIETQEDSYYTLHESLLYTATSGSLEGYTDTNGNPVRFVTASRWQQLPDTYEEVPFFEAGLPLRIYHKTNAGYVVLSHPGFFTNLDKDHRPQLRLFFETMMYVYLHGYCRTGRQTTCITDETIDYFINTAQRYYLKHPRINLEQLLAKNGQNTAIQHEILECDTVPSDKSFTVSYTGMNRFHDLLFQKKSQVKDPAKGNNVLVYTTEGTILCCDASVASYRLVESGIRIRQVDKYTVGIAAAQSSTYGIATTEEQQVSLPDPGEYTIYYNRAAGIFTTQYSTACVPVASVSVIQNTNIRYRDLRKLGGGEASATPNYDMIDTGNLYGRPYRYGCPLIIQLPSRLKTLDKEIRSEVGKHVASGDYPIIVYKD